MTGFLDLNKPPGVTSRDVVNAVVRLVGRRTKAGHAGTLDPLASGVLVVAVGSATRLIEHVQAQAKSYRAVVRLGARSDTLDADGQIEEVSDPPVPDEAAVRAALASQVGMIEQIPPQFSALKVGGRRAYDLARRGEAVELAARPVRIDRVELLRYAWPRLEIAVDCGAGTYIRSIARDVGEALGCGGLIEVLERTAVGVFRLADALDPAALRAESLAGHLRPLTDAVPDLPRVPLDPEQADRIARGAALDARRLAPPPPPGELALLAPDGTLLALAEHDPAAGHVRPRRVLHP
jgi:tRNA pseudouridine55 synthase